MINAEERISDLEDRLMEITQSKQQTGNQMQKNEGNVRDLQENIKWVNLHIIGIPEGEEREKGIENVFEEIIAENFPNLKKEHPDTGSTEGPTQVEPKQTYTKTYYNKSGES